VNGVISNVNGHFASYLSLLKADAYYDVTIAILAIGTLDLWIQK